MPTKRMARERDTVTKLRGRWPPKPENTMYVHQPSKWRLLNSQRGQPLQLLLLALALLQRPLSMAKQHDP